MRGSARDDGGWVHGNDIDGAWIEAEGMEEEDEGEIKDDEIQTSIDGCLTDGK